MTLLHLPGSLLFCPDCGTLLNLPRDEENEVACEQCGHVEPASCESGLPAFANNIIDCSTAYENITIVTRSHPDAFPSALRQKGKTQTKTHDSEDALLKVRPLKLFIPSSRSHDYCAVGHRKVPKLWSHGSIFKRDATSQCGRRLNNLVHSTSYSSNIPASDLS